ALVPPRMPTIRLASDVGVDWARTRSRLTPITPKPANRLRSSRASTRGVCHIRRVRASSFGAARTLAKLLRGRLGNQLLSGYDGSPVRARLVVPLVVLCAALAAAPAALAAPHLNKTQSRVVSDIVERWVNDVVRGRDLADGWKIAGAAERGA